MPHRPWPFLVMAIPVLLLACSSAPPTSNNNLRYTDATISLKRSDFSGALTNLDKAIKTAPNESLRQQAIVLRIALATALAEANKQMAEAYATGARQPAAQAHTGPFYNMRSDYYNAAHTYLMDAMQTTMSERSKLSANAMPLEVSFPGFTGTNPGLTKIKSGVFVSDTERLNAELQEDRNALAAVFSAIGGAGHDPDKGQQVFSSGKVEIDPRVFIIELTCSFIQTGAMFDFRGVNKPDRLRTVNEVVRGNLDVAEKLLAAKPDKDMEAHIKKMQTECEKTLKKTTT
ncbi:MAG: hypothetical protein WBL63_09700 [Candidatus Acidiferrum sp.]